MAEPKYIILPPSKLKGNCTNYHIFEGEPQPGLVGYVFQTVSQCGKVERRSIPHTDDHGYAEQMRTVASNMQNKGAPVCGQCVATLYSDEE